MDCATRMDRSFLGINCQLIIAGKLQLITLSIVEMKEKHTAENLKKIICSELDKYGIELKNVYAVTTDNGANLLKCVKILKQKDESEIDSSTTSATAKNDG